jgi:hypothetical protein
MRSFAADDENCDCFAHNFYGGFVAVASSFELFAIHRKIIALLLLLVESFQMDCQQALHHAS